MNVTNEDFDTLDPRVRAQLLAERGDTLESERKHLEAIKRGLADEEYEASTVGAGAWRERVAQRHRFGKVQDMPPWRPGERGRLLTPLQRREMATQAAIVVLMIVVLLGLLAYALFGAPPDPH